MNNHEKRKKNNISITSNKENTKTFEEIQEEERDGHGICGQLHQG